MIPTQCWGDPLNVASELAESGVLEKYGVELIGANLVSIKKAEDRQAFKEAMVNIGIQVPKSSIALTVDEALNIAEVFSYPVVIHSLSNSQVMIGSSTSIAHWCIVHGPCRIGEGCFVGFGAVVFDSIIGNNTLVLHNATVRGVEIPPGKMVQDGETITKQEDADGLMNITQELAEFKEGVIKINRALVKAYKKHAKDV